METGPPDGGLLTPDGGEVRGEIRGEPDPATVAALVRGEQRPHATPADLRDAALTLRDEDLTPTAIARQLEQDLGQVRAWLAADRRERWGWTR